MRLPPTGSLTGFLFLFILLFSPAVLPGAVAQRNAPDIPTASGAFVLENARIVQSAGRTIDNGSILVRDGRIVAVGAQVSVPYDARRIDLSGKTVYPAFVDGLSLTGVREPSQTQNLSPVPDRSNPPDDRAGIQPQRSVVDFIDPEHKSIDALRKEGFAAAHIVPRGQMLPGSGAVVLLAGESAGDMVLEEDYSLFTQFQGARGMYPGTPMAMTAKMRQLFREAARRQSLQTNFDASASGTARPEFDPVHYAFFPVLDGTKSIFFFVDDALEIHRALKLQEDLGFNLMLGGLHEAFDTVDELADSVAPLFLTLDLPDKPDLDG